MNASQKLTQYLREAKASENALVRVLQSQIAMAPAGSYRTGLETHLEETRDHSRRVSGRIRELAGGRDPVGLLVGLAEETVGQTLALAKTPLDLMRGSGGEEKVLKNAKDAAATEALEIATYTAIEQLASSVGDEETARLARAIRGDEEKMLSLILREIPKLTEAVVRAELQGDPSYDVSRTGAADTIRDAGEKFDEPWPGYDELTVAEVQKALPTRNEQEIRAVRSYEVSHKDRAGVIKATERHLEKAS
jgi:ferritin-like metal-binding protein YciE